MKHKRRRKTEAGLFWILLAGYLSSLAVAVLLAELIVRYLRGVSLVEVFFGQ